MNTARRKRVAKLYELNRILKKSYLINKFAKNEPTQAQFVELVNTLQGGPNFSGKGTDFSYLGNDHIFRAVYNNNIWPSRPGSKITFNFISSYAEAEQPHLVEIAKGLVERAAGRLGLTVKFVDNLSPGWNPGGSGGYWLHLLYYFESKNHTVQPGENLTIIARKYSVSTEELASFNNIQNPNQIRPGQVLKIP